MFCTSFHTVIHEWNCEAKIFPTFYYLYTGFIWVMENLESYVIYEFHFPGLESHEILFLVMESHGKFNFCLVDI